VVKICTKCHNIWPGGYRCPDAECRGALIHTDDARAQELPELVWRNQRVDYGARRGMVFRFQAMVLGIVLALVGVRAPVPLDSPWNIAGIIGSLLGGLVVYYVLHEAAHRAVRVWVLRRGQLDKKKLAKALIANPKRG
jgi:xanthosine utilization system XapX-like protein